MFSKIKKFGFILGLIVLVVVLLLPTPEGLSSAGHRMLALLLFSVIVWVTEAISYPVSAALIVSLMTFFIGLSPNPENPSVLLGTSAGLKVAIAGFANNSLALVAAAMFISVAMMKTGLDRRIALIILSKIGVSAKRILAGIFLVGFVLSFFVPSSTARVSCMVPIVMGIIAAFGVERKSRLACVFMIAVAQADGIWRIYV